MKKNYIYSTNVGFFNTSEGTIKIDVTALNGDVITNTFKYVNTGANEDFVLKSTDIQVPTKEKATYIMATDLLNGESVQWDGEEKDTEKPTGKDTLDYIAFIKNSNGTISFEILKEVIPDYKLFLLNYINEEKLSSNEGFFGYLPFSTALMMKLEVYSMQLQILNNITDWHFKINYYDYNTNELLSTENIR